MLSKDADKMNKKYLGNKISKILHLILKITLAQKREGVKKLTSEFHNASPKVLLIKSWVGAFYEIESQIWVSFMSFFFLSFSSPFPFQSSKPHGMCYSHHGNGAISIEFT